MADDKSPASSVQPADSTAGSVPDAEQAKVDLALQVANVAAQVSAAMRSADEGERDQLQARLFLAKARLEQQGAPEGIVPFLDVMGGLLRGEDVSALSGDLPITYRAVYEQLVGELEAEETERMLSVREVLDEVAHNVILAMVRGTFDHRLRMAETLQAMAGELSSRPDLSGLRDLLLAAQLMLQDEDPEPVVDRLRGPFKARWQEIVEAVQDERNA